MQGRLILLGVLGALCLGLYLSLSALFTARSELASTQRTVDTLNATVAAYKANAEHVAIVVHDSAADKQVIDHALSTNQDWASTAVPDAVVAGLCKNSVCKTGEVLTSGDQPK